MANRKVIHVTNHPQERTMQQRYGRLTHLYLSLGTKYLYLDGVPAPISPTMPRDQRDVLINHETLGQFVELLFDAAGFVAGGRIVLPEAVR
jgi:hypothetical protein